MNPTHAPTAAATPRPATTSAPVAVRTPAHRLSGWRDPARRLGAAFLAAVLLGAVAALAARELMGLLTRLAGDEARFGVVETVLTVLVFVVPMLPGAIAAAWRMRRLATVLLTFGAGSLLLESVVIALQEDRGAVIDQGGGAVALALLVVVAMWGLIVLEAVAVGRASRAWGGARAGTPS